MASSDLNIMGDVYEEFLTVINNITIKYLYKAAEYDTLEIKKAADQYIDALNETDNFDSYSSYTLEELHAVGIYDESIISKVLQGDISAIPESYRDALVQNKRSNIINNYEEKNNYYRMYNGYPSVETDEDDYIYLDEYQIEIIGLPDDDIPLHLIQDYYNKINAGDGDKYIRLIEANNYINEFIEEYPDYTYLNYIGSNRISIKDLRSAKNFDIIQFKSSKVSNVIYQEFTQTYEKCRRYFVNVIYNSGYIDIFPYYDNFIGLSIMVMTLNDIIMRQIPLGINRQFYNKSAVKALYEAYNIPNNINIDNDIQSRIVQNLNLLIQHKATDKELYDIAEILGFSGINIYKYYLMKEQKFDQYDVPIIAWKEVFNNDTAEFDTVPDYETMFDFYFQRSIVKNDNINTTFNDSNNHVKYRDVIDDDPYWIEDTKLSERLYESNYNYVESKYLSLSIAYSMTDLIFDSVVLLKLLLYHKNTTKDITLTLNKITNDFSEIPLYDVIILLICLTSAKHELTGEIITEPTQVIAVRDYAQNLEDCDLMVDTLSFDFDLFKSGNPDGDRFKEEMKKALDEDAYNEFMDYISILSINEDLTAKEKIALLNKMYKNVKGLYKFLVYQMGITKNNHVYEVLKRMYKAAYYSQEMASIFEVTTPYTETTKIPHTYFEYLYYENPKLYNCIFKLDLKTEYSNYLTEHGLTPEEFTYEEFTANVESPSYIYNETTGEYEENEDHIELQYDVMKDITTNDSTKTDIKDEKIYYYINHIISRLDDIIEDVNYTNLIQDSESPAEELLMKLIRYFKSYTVDLLDLEHLYICDMKPENLLKFLDEMTTARKIDETHEYMNLSHSDVMHKLEIYFNVRDDKKFKDIMTELIYLYIYDNDPSGKIRNSVRMQDYIKEFVKTDLHKEPFEFFDINHQITENLYVINDNSIRMKDKVLMFFDE